MQELLVFFQKKINNCSYLISCHRYPSDVDKHILARQTGLSRSQVRANTHWLATSIQLNEKLYICIIHVTINKINLNLK